MHYLMFHCSNLHHLYNNNYNNNYSFIILICLQPSCKSRLFVILLIRLFAILLLTLLQKHLFVRSSQGRSLITQVYTRLTELLVADCLLYFAFLYTHAISYMFKLEGLHSLLLENSIGTACICAFSYLSV